MSFYRNKRILVTGGTGLIGISLVKRLLKEGANVKVASLDDPPTVNTEAEYIQGNLCDWAFCKSIVKNIDLVFHLAGTKGSVSTGIQKAASFFVPHLVFNTFMMEAARQGEIDRYLYTSTIGVYPPAKIFKEENAWDGPPHYTNYYAGWAKRMGELQAEAYRSEFGWSRIAIVRPANVYGPFDYFEPDSSMVIPSLIRRAVNGENPFVVWGDGSAIRDFVYSDDVAEGMLLALEKAADGTPLNLGSGIGYSIKTLVNIIQEYIPELNVEWDFSKPQGEDIRVLDISRAKERLGYLPRTDLRHGIQMTLDWYRKYRRAPQKHFNVFHHRNLIDALC